MVGDVTVTEQGGWPLFLPFAGQRSSTRGIRVVIREESFIQMKEFLGISQDPGKQVCLTPGQYRTHTSRIWNSENASGWPNNMIQAQTWEGESYPFSDLCPVCLGRTFFH